VGASQRCPLVIPGLTDLDQEGRTRESQESHGQGFSDKPCTGPAHVRACLDPMERERESAKLLLFCTFFALLDPNTPKCKRANATVILLIMD
jgi:hypothetical protein